MEKEAEGYMVMFPAQMLHQVFPFYENDGERISISGNINIEKKEG
jgi:polyhydroxyalkanoate synthesis regulator protein